MSPKKILFKPEYSLELLNIAKGDLESAKELYMSINKGRLENVLYLAQQAAEKALKAAINSLRISFPMVHELGTLVALLPDDKLPPNGFDLSQLNPYATVRRYEEPIAELTDQEITDCIGAVEEVLKWADEIVNGTKSNN